MLKTNNVTDGRQNLAVELRSSGQRYLIAAIVALFPVVAPAQGLTDTGALYSGIAFSVASLVILILGFILFRRLSGRRKNDLADDAGLDLMTLRKKNLLTPEEMKMVSAAIARRMAEKESRQMSKGSVTAATLLHDPEVMRLQELARVRREQEEAEGKAPPAAPPEPAMPEVTVAPPMPSIDGGMPVISPLYSPGPVPPSDDNVGDPIGLSDPEEDIALPAEVQQLADAGLLSPEEIENVKQRLRQRKTAGN